MSRCVRTLLDVRNLARCHVGVERLKSEGFTNVLGESTDTNIRYSAGDMSSPKLKTQSTMWLKDGVQKAYTGEAIFLLICLICHQLFFLLIYLIILMILFFMCSNCNFNFF